MRQSIPCARCGEMIGPHYALFAHLHTTPPAARNTARPEQRPGLKEKIGRRLKHYGYLRTMKR